MVRAQNQQLPSGLFVLFVSFCAVLHGSAFMRQKVSSCGFQPDKSTIDAVET
jgi:hypothetical protein